MERSVGMVGLMLCMALVPAARAQQQFAADVTPNETRRTREVVEWAHLRDADIAWRKRVERVIDLREKQNLPLKWPGNPMSELLMRAVSEGRITAYHNENISIAYTLEEAVRRGSRQQFIGRLIDPEDPEAGTIDTLVVEMLRSEQIIGYKLIEEWVFDQKHGTMHTRIQAIQPMYRRMNTNGDFIGIDYLYTIRYNDFRKLMVNEPVFNRFNNQMQLTYDDFFEQRLFSSYIVKESNAFDAAIREMPEFAEDGIAALLEAERIKQDIANLEHDLWEY